MLENQLQDYAHLLITKGVNLQQGQTLVINVDVESKDFAIIVTKIAYELGASEVIVNWRCQPIAKERLLHASEDVLSSVAPWIPPYYQTYVDKKAAFLSLISANPEAMKGVDATRASLASRTLNSALTFYHESIMGSALTWCVASVATPLWADLLGYTGSEEEKVNALWQTIFTLCRITPKDDNEALHAHLETLANRTKKLNDLHLTKLHYTAENGTDLYLELPEKALWLGGSEKSQEGIIFNANIPTEEVFSAPLREGLNGIVYSTKPLIYQGNRINNFALTFEQGRIIKITAEEGEEYLEKLVETDEGSHYIGEVALVDHYSPISASNQIYFETLFDENASCHLAIGSAYPICYEGGEQLTEEELKKVGLNKSLTHVDFMIGHVTMNIDGYTKDGHIVSIMKNGRLNY